MIDRRTTLLGIGSALAIPALSQASGQPVGATSLRAPARDLRFRWINNAGFELALPGGAHLLIDPWLDSASSHPLAVQDIERADYVLLSHIHPDHVEDIGALQRRFPNVRIFVGQLSAEPLAKAYNLDTSKLYKVSDRQEFEFGEVRIKAFAGRHTESKRGNHLTWDSTGELTAASWGTLDLFQYLITLPNKTKFMVWAGTPSIDNAYALENLRPDIVAMHISPKQDLSMLGEIIRRMQPRTIIPHHYDIWPSVLENRPEEAAQFPAEVQPVTAANVIQKMMPHVETTLARHGMSGRFFVPEPHRWYRYDKKSGSPAPD